MRTTRVAGWVLGSLALAAPARAQAGESDRPAGKSPPASKRDAKPQIEWVHSVPDAMEEAAERNVPIYLHSHANTCPPCKAIHRAVFEDAAYVAWANEATIHVLSYDVHADADPEPLVEVERDGGKVSVFAAYPTFTPDEMRLLLGEIGKRVDFPLHTPWAGVLSPDGKKVLAEVVKGGPKEFRAAYEEGQKKLGTPYPRAAWKKVRAAVQASIDAEYAEQWKRAAAAALEARSLSKGAPPPLAERVDARVASLVTEGRRLLADAKKQKRAADATAAEAKVREDFAGIPLD
jgi:hypothetical protein